MTENPYEEFEELSLQKRIIYCCKEYAIVLKLPGDSSEDSLPELFSSVIADINGQVPEVISCPHRLDKPVTGVQIIALTQKSLAFFTNEFAQQKVEKKYWAIVEGINYVPQSDTLSGFLQFNPEKKKAHLFKEERRKTKKVILDYKVIGQGERYSFVEVTPKTGRTHQIRVQLADIGMHIKGDVKYGARRADTIPGIRLFAHSIECNVPNSKKRMTFEANIYPNDNLWQAFQTSYKDENE